MKATSLTLTAMLLVLCLITGGCQSTASAITVENRTVGDVILVTDQLSGEVSHLVPACGRIVFDPLVRPTLDPSSSHPEAAVIPYHLGLVPDAPTQTTIVITSDQVWQPYGSAPSLPACEGNPPIVSPRPAP